MSQRLYLMCTGSHQARSWRWVFLSAELRPLSPPSMASDCEQCPFRVQHYTCDFLSTDHLKIIRVKFKLAASSVVSSAFWERKLAANQEKSRLILPGSPRQRPALSACPHSGLSECVMSLEREGGKELEAARSWHETSHQERQGWGGGQWWAGRQTRHKSTAKAMSLPYTSQPGHSGPQLEPWHSRGVKQWGGRWRCMCGGGRRSLEMARAEVCHLRSLVICGKAWSLWWLTGLPAEGSLTRAKLGSPGLLKGSTPWSVGGGSCSQKLHSVLKYSAYMHVSLWQNMLIVFLIEYNEKQSWTVLAGEGVQKPDSG